MALVLADRVKETTTTTGTGTVTLAGAIAGYRSFATVGNGNTTYYTISGQTTSEWEVGIGTYTTVGTTLSRTTVLSSSNGGSLVVFSAGTKDVFVTYPAGRSVNVDAANTGVSVPQLSATSIINSGLTSGRVVYSTTGGLETDSANLTFNGTTLTANTIGAFTLSGTIAGGGNQINNVIIGTTTPLAGAFTTLSATGVTTVQAGTALLPAIVSTTGTADTGIWFPAADTVAASTAGTERMRIDSSGNVGIGVTPSASTWFGGAISNLDIARSATYSIINSKAYSTLSYGGGVLVLGHSKSATVGTQVATASGDTFGGISFEGVNSSSAIAGATYIYAIQDGANGVTYIPGALTFYTGTSAAAPTERMRISSAGNVGIGTSSPLYKLNVVGADATLVALFSGATNGIRIIPQTTSVEIAATDKTGTVSYQKLDLNGSSLAFLISGTTRMTLNSSGDLGIGTTSPGARLDVQNANAYGRIKSTSGTYALFDIDSPAAYQPIIRFLSNGVEQARIISPVNEAASQLVFTTGTSGTERMRIDASGNVGIGTTAPVTKLNISGSSTVAGELGTLAITGSTTAKRLTFGVDSTSTMYGWIQSVENGVSTRDLVLQSLGGNVGIGTSSPAVKLDVQATTAIVKLTSTTGTNAAYLQTANTSGSFYCGVDDSLGGTTVVPYGRFVYGAGAYPLMFFTNSAERMRIESGGNLLVGTTASTGSAANTASVVGGIFKTASGTVSAATATATTIFTCPTLGTGLYLVNAQLDNNDPVYYGAVSLVGVGNTTLRATSLATGTNITITVSGQTIRSTQTSGSTQTITWTVTRLS